MFLLIIEKKYCVICFAQGENCTGFIKIINRFHADTHKLAKQCSSFVVLSCVEEHCISLYLSHPSIQVPEYKIMFLSIIEEKQYEIRIVQGGELSWFYNNYEWIPSIYIPSCKTMFIVRCVIIHLGEMQLSVCQPIFHLFSLE
jgi:hypothetical protein